MFRRHLFGTGSMALAATGLLSGCAKRTPPALEPAPMPAQGPRAAIPRTVPLLLRTPAALPGPEADPDAWMAFLPQIIGGRIIGDRILNRRGSEVESVGSTPLPTAAAEARARALAAAAPAPDPAFTGFAEALRAALARAGREARVIPPAARPEPQGEASAAASTPLVIIDCRADTDAERSLIVAVAAVRYFPAGATMPTRVQNCIYVSDPINPRSPEALLAALEACASGLADIIQRHVLEAGRFDLAGRVWRKVPAAPGFDAVFTTAGRVLRLGAHRSQVLTVWPSEANTTRELLVADTRVVPRGSGARFFPYYHANSTAEPRGPASPGLDVPCLLSLPVAPRFRLPEAS